MTQVYVEMLRLISIALSFLIIFVMTPATVALIGLVLLDFLAPSLDAWRSFVSALHPAFPRLVAPLA
ncbi:MAG: hypothetical protein AAF909_03660 [Pseudomonadota bacterium]